MTIEHGLAREFDPDTSHAAAESVDAAKLCEIIYAEIARYGDDGCISDDVAIAFPHIGIQSLSPRYRQMIDAGMLELTGEKRQGRLKHLQLVRRVLPPPFKRVAKQNSGGTEEKLFAALTDMLSVFYKYRSMGLWEAQAIDDTEALLRKIENKY
jgi:hypothetical protein